MVKHDFRQGIIKYIWIYIVFAGVCYWGANYYYVIQYNQNEIMGTAEPASAVGMLLYLVHGMEKYVAGPDQEFRLSIAWIVPLVVLSYSAYGYPLNDLQTFGYNYMIRTKSRARWWWSKCIWMLLHVLICCVICVAMCGLCALVKHQPVWEALSQAQLSQMNLDAMWEMPVSALAGCIGLYLLMLLALCMLQLLLSMLVKPIIAYVILLVVYVSSAYCTTWLLPANYLMLQRYSCFLEDGVPVATGYMVALVILLAALTGGWYYMKKKDIMC